MSDKKEFVKPERPGHNGQEEMEQLYKLAAAKKLHIGMLIKPKRNPEELKEDKDSANIVLVIGNARSPGDYIIASDEVTESLAVSAKFLTEELKTYNG